MRLKISSQISFNNAALAFMSLGVKVDQSVLRHGPPVFWIHGELRHILGSLLSEESVPPHYLQLYIFDPHEAYWYHILRNENLSLHTMQILQHVMHNYNAIHPFTSMLVKSFKGITLLIIW